LRPVPHDGVDLGQPLGAGYSWRPSRRRSHWVEWMASALGPHSYVALLGEPSFFRLFLAGAASAGGVGVTSVCLVWIVYASTYSAWAIAALGIATAVSGLASSLISGVMVDRYDRQRLMVMSDTGRAVVLIALALSFIALGFELWAFVVASVLLAFFTAIFQPAEATFLPRLIPRGRIADANGLLTSSQLITGLAGTLLGGALIVTVGVASGLWAATITFALSAVLIQAIVPPSPSAGRGSPAPMSERGSVIVEVRRGFEWLFAHRPILGFTLSSMAFNFLAAIPITFLVFYTTVALQGSAFLFALLTALGALGGALGALAVGRLSALRHAGASWIVSYGLAGGLSVVALGVYHAVPVAAAALFVLGFTQSYAATIWSSVVLIGVPASLQGRVMGVDSLLSIVLLPGAVVLGALLIRLVGTQETYLLSGVAWAASALAFLAWKDLRTFRCEETPSPGSMGQ